LGFLGGSFKNEERVMEKAGFRELLKQRQISLDSLVCVGLDPVMEKMPEIIRKEYGYTWQGVEKWMSLIVSATAEHASLFKPNHAHYEAFEGGQRALIGINEAIHGIGNDCQSFLDCKRGDIDRTQERYRFAHFEIENVDGMNFNPYMGIECMVRLIDRANPGRSIVGLGRTSNPSAWMMQDVPIYDGRRYWEYAVSKIKEWALEFGIADNAGVVMGAAHTYEKLAACPFHTVDPDDYKKVYDWHLLRAREIVGDLLWLLIPGIGKQENDVAATVKASFCGPGSVAINSSSAIIFASSRSDFAEASAKKAAELVKQIRDSGGSVREWMKKAKEKL
jgi:orotidine-5'-phosphate decarboxylase